MRERDGFPEAVTVEFCGKLCPPWQNSGRREQWGKNIFEKEADVAEACLRSDAGQVGTQFTPHPSPLGLSLVPTCLPPGCLLHLSLLPFKPQHAWLFLQLTRANWNQILNDP